MAARVDAGACREQDPAEHDDPGIAAARVNEANQRALDARCSRASHPAMPPERLATLRLRPAASAGTPPDASSCRKSDRCTATRLIDPSVNTSTACHPAVPRRMT